MKENVFNKKRKENVSFRQTLVAREGTLSLTLMTSFREKEREKRTMFTISFHLILIIKF